MPTAPRGTAASGRALTLLLDVGEGEEEALPLADAEALSLPLALALPGVWRRNIYTMQWASMLILVYFAEGIVRGMSDRGLSATLGWCETALAVGFFVAALAYVAPFKRAAKKSRAAS